MSERQNDSVEDATVSAHYRELAAEQPSAELDAAVLRAAQAAGKRSYVRLRFWTQPLAWAATIGLSLVIVLQLLDTTPAPQPLQPEPALEAKPEQTATTADSIADADTESRSVDAGRAAPSAEDLFTPRNRELLREAEEMAQMQNGNNTQADSSAAPAAAKALRVDSARTESAANNACDEETRAKPDDWLACIESLEAEQRLDDARLEKQAFEQAWPAF